MEHDLRLPVKNGEVLSEERGSVERRLAKVKQATSGLVEILLAKDSSSISREFGECLRALITPSADRELGLQGLMELLSKTNVSVDEFCKVIGLPVTFTTDSEELGPLVECCLALLSLTIDDEIEVVQR